MSSPNSIIREGAASSPAPPTHSLESHYPGPYANSKLGTTRYWRRSGRRRNHRYGNSSTIVDDLSVILIVTIVVLVFLISNVVIGIMDETIVLDLI